MNLPITLPKYAEFDASTTQIDGECICAIEQNKSICRLCEHFAFKRYHGSRFFGCNASPNTKDFSYVVGYSEVDRYVECKERNSCGECDMFVLSSKFVVHHPVVPPTAPHIEYRVWKRFVHAIRKQLGII